MKASVLNALLKLFKDSYEFYSLEVQFGSPTSDRVFWRVGGDLYAKDYYYDTNGNQVSKYFFGDGETIEEAFKNLETKLVRILGVKQ
jgi:hypothetical protein